jgi:predicted nuclease with TOPRIM domain
MEDELNTALVEKCAKLLQRERDNAQWFNNLKHDYDKLRGYFDSLCGRHREMTETAKELHEALTEAQALIYGTQGEQPYAPLLASSRKVLNAA